MRDQLDKLVQEMLDRGILYDDARREFEKMFITRALQRSKGSVGDAAELLGRLTYDDRLRADIIRGQHARLDAFSEARLQAHLDALLAPFA